MLFRPSFCANCGEKIERAEWKLTTSRRFCDVCESVNKGYDLIPRVAVIAGVVMMLLGVGSFLTSGRHPDEPRRLPLQAAKSLVQNETLPKVREQSETMTFPVNDSPVPADRRPTAPPPVRKATPVFEGAIEPSYFCGAETKKGTPCSRRVKGPTRCYQHAGMPAMTVGKRS
ncbi:MAG: hypothetical protein WKF34_10825 [Pyrinomonadaceae bacterium]